MLHKAIMFVVICNNKSQKLRPFPLQRTVAAVTRMCRTEKKNGWQKLISFRSTWLLLIYCFLWLRGLYALGVGY